MELQNIDCPSLAAALLVRAWIEIDMPAYPQQYQPAALLVRAWIEIAGIVITDSG